MRTRNETKATELGQTALVGWRQKVAGGLAGPASERTRLTQEQARALIGALFFVLSLYYVVGTVYRALKATRT